MWRHRRGDWWAWCACIIQVLTSQFTGRRDKSKIGPLSVWCTVAKEKGKGGHGGPVSETYRGLRSCSFILSNLNGGMDELRVQCMPMHSYQDLRTAPLASESTTVGNTRGKRSCQSRHVCLGSLPDQRDPRHTVHACYNYPQRISGLSILISRL